MEERIALTLVTAVLSLLPLVAGFALFWRGPETLAGLMHHAAWGTRAPAAGPISPLVAIFSRFAPALIVYAALTAWFVWRREPGAALTAWVPLAMMLVFSSGVWFPWYFVWPFMVSLARWNRLHVALSAACAVMAALLTAIYTLPFSP